MRPSIAGIVLGSASWLTPSMAEQSATKSPAATEAYNAGTAAVAAGDLSKAETEFQKAAKLSPENADMQLALGKVLLHRGDLASAAIHMLAAINAKPGIGSSPFLPRVRFFRCRESGIRRSCSFARPPGWLPRMLDPHRALARANECSRQDA